MSEERRQTWSRGGLRGRRRWPCSTSRSIGKAPSPSVLKDQIGAGFVVHTELHPVTVAEVELRQIPVEMGFRDVLVNAVDAALEDAEVTLNGVGVDIAPDVFLGAVVDGLVPTTEAHADVGGHTAIIGHVAAVGVDVLGQDWPQVVGIDVGDVEAADMAPTLHQGYDNLLGRDDIGIGAVRCLAADVALVAFHGAPWTTQRLVANGLHGFPDAHGHKPSGLEGDAHSPVDLVGADPLFAGCDQVDGLQPDMERHMAALEHGANLHGEWLHAGVALPQTGPGGLTVQALGLTDDAAFRANRLPIRPDARLKKGEGGALILEMCGGENGLGHRICSYGLNTTSRVTVCQV